MGHLTCVGSSVTELRSVIGSYADAGVRNVLALRGDPPGGPGSEWVQHPEGLAHADELVSLVRSLGDFCVGVAAFPERHPESPSTSTPTRACCWPSRRPARSSPSPRCSSRPTHYFALVDRARALGLHDADHARGSCRSRTSARSSGSRSCRARRSRADLAARFRAVADDPDAVHALGVEAAAALCEELLDAGAPGLHFFTLNRSTSTREIYTGLGLATYA